MSLPFRARSTKDSFTGEIMERVERTSFQVAGDKKRHLWPKDKVRKRDLEEACFETNRQNKVESVCSEVSQVIYELGWQNKSSLREAENESISFVNRAARLTLSYLLIY